jgi:hypothetical protein
VAQRVDQEGRGGAEFVVGQAIEGVQDEHCSGCLGGEPGAHALPPVPPPARDAQVVAPHDLPGQRVLGRRLARGHRVERLLAGGHDQPEWPSVGVDVLAADRDDVRDGHRVVDVGEPVDAGHSVGHAAQQGIDARAEPLRLCPESPERLSPGDDVRMPLPRVGRQVPAASLDLRKQRFAVLVARPGHQVLGEDQACPVGREPVADGRFDRRGGQEAHTHSLVARPWR